MRNTSLLLTACASSIFFAQVRADAFQTLEFPGAVNTTAQSISGNKIVGVYWNSSSALQHGFIYDGVNFSTLDFPGSSSTGASGIDGDQIVGGYITSRVFGFNSTPAR